MRAINFNISYQQRAVLFWSIFLFLLMLTATYLYLVNSLIFGAVERQSQTDILSKVQSEVAVLEAVRLQKTGKITLDMAYELGFKDATAETIFVDESYPN